MIDKQWSTYVLVCDCCGDKGSNEYDTWQDAVDGKSKEGWKSKKYSDGWKDLCPECQD